MIPLTAELTPQTPYYWRAARPGHRHRLICLPHAGAGASAFAAWARLLPDWIELIAVQLPGRQNRIAEEPFRDSRALLRVLLPALRPVLTGSFSLFGHSGGGFLAHALAGALQQHGRRAPEQVFLSGCPAPGTAGIPVLHDLPEEEFRSALVALGGLHGELLEDEDVMASLLPLLRADFELWERHHPQHQPVLDSPVIAVGGDQDPRAPWSGLTGWERYAAGSFQARTFPGGHFYFEDDLPGVVAFVADRIRDGLRTPDLDVREVPA